MWNCWVESLKGVEVTVCGIKCVNVKVNTIKIFAIHFSYNNKLNMIKHFLTTLSSIQNVLKIWLMRNLTLEGKIIVFKTLTLSKIDIHLCLSSVVLKQIIEEIEIQSDWKKILNIQIFTHRTLFSLDHHLVKYNYLLNIEKLKSRKLYCIINSSRNNKSTSHTFWAEVWLDSIRLEGHLYITTKTYHIYVFKIALI